MTTHNTLKEYIGKSATLRGNGSQSGIAYQVKINDARSNFGRNEVQVSPIAGTGAAWVSVESVTIETKP